MIEDLSEAQARLAARKPLCTSEFMERFAKADLPEIAGNLGKRFSVLKGIKAVSRYVRAATGKLYALFTKGKHHEKPKI
jgi:hypothetical protein